MRIYGSAYEDIWSALELDERTPVVISVVGAGGKSSLIKHLSNALNQKQIYHVIATTTHMWPMQTGIFGKQMGKIGSDGKVMPPDEEEWQQIFSKGVPVFIEADGSKGLPCKAPEAWEPVLRKETSHVFAVLGVRCLGERVKDVCHRPKRVQHVLSCDAEHQLNEDDLAALMICKEGLRKNVADQWAYYCVFNQVDDTVCYERIRWVEKRIREHGVTDVFFTHLK